MSITHPTRGTPLVVSVYINRQYADYACDTRNLIGGNELRRDLRYCVSLPPARFLTRARLSAAHDLAG
jgi:hypothetical protein